ncbi:hypothetical protein [Deinococcus sp. UYEF24]
MEGTAHAARELPDGRAELELRHLHEKIDHLTQQQWQRLLVIQQAQMDLMREVAERDRQT